MKGAKVTLKIKCFLLKIVLLLKKKKDIYAVFIGAPK